MHNKNICHLNLRSFMMVKKLLFNFKLIKTIVNIILILFLLLKRVYEYPYHRPCNSRPIILDIKIYNNQGYHPKVLSFNSLWNGYKYWIAYTPYPHGDETKENPFINASNDLIHWKSPKELKNPLDIPLISNIDHYNSDTHLLYNNNTNELTIVWRYVNLQDNQVSIYFKKSKDGINWSEKEIFIKSNNRTEQDYVSPCINYENGIYRMWYVHRKKIFYLEKNGEKITEPKLLNINYDNNYYTWHIDIIYNEEKKLYELITCAYIDINDRSAMPLFYLSSRDNIIWSKPIIILKPAINTLKFDSQGLYRSSLLYENGTYYLFYSAHDKYKNTGIGLMYGRNITQLKPYF